MKLFKFSETFKGICREEVEVIEKEKTFQEIKGLNKSVYKKSDLDVVKYSYNRVEMLSLDGNPEKFVKIVLKNNQKKLETLEKQIENTKEFMSVLSHQYRGILKARVVDEKYYTVGHIVFAQNGEGISGQHTETNPDDFIKVSNIISGKELISYINNKINININNIFVNGNSTNLSIAGFENNDNSDMCVVSVDKLKDVILKAKVEVDINFS